MRVANQRGALADVAPPRVRPPGSSPRAPQPGVGSELWFLSRPSVRASWANLGTPESQNSCKFKKFHENHILSLNFSDLHITQPFRENRENQKTGPGGRTSLEVLENTFEFRGFGCRWRPEGGFAVKSTLLTKLPPLS